MKSDRPNVIFVLADDLGFGDLGCYGNSVLRTPNLDRLAREGVRCDQYYSPSPLCAPARAGILAGRYNHRTGALSVESNRGIDRIALRERTIGDEFRSLGYRTGYVGKWHNGLHDLRYHPMNRGFDSFIGFLNGGMDYYDWTLDRNGTPVPGDGRYLTDVFTSEAIDFVDGCDGDPFFLYLAYNAPHAPLQGPDELVAHYQGFGLNPAVATLYAMIESMDRGIGQLVAKLEGEGRLDNTVVVFTSDNGPWLGQEQLAGATYSVDRFNGPFRGMKQDVLEGGIRVPAIVRWGSGLPAGHVCRLLLHGCDWLPTLVGACGGAPSGLPLDGLNRLDVLRGNDDEPRQPRYWQFNRYDPVFGCNMAMRDGNWKLYWPRIESAMAKEETDTVAYRESYNGPHRLMPVANPTVRRHVPGPHTPELYDIAEDPGEANNVVGNHRERAARMAREALAWFEDVESDRVG